MFVSFDYSLKLKSIRPDKSFPVISFPGLGRSEFSLVPYSENNIVNMRKRKSTIAKIRNYPDIVARDNAFRFAEGFNDVGLCVDFYDDDGSISASMMRKDSVNPVFSSFPGVIAYECGRYVANKCNDYQSKVEKRNFHSDPFSFNFSNERDYLYQINTNSYNNFKPYAIPREDVINLFRLGAEEKDFLFLLPIIELFAKVINNGQNPHYIFPTFIALNEFLEYGKDNDYFIDFFSDENNAAEVSRQFNDLKVNKYAHTQNIINSMILPDRFLNNNFISLSGIRKVISEQKKNSLLTMTKMTIPVPSNNKVGEASIIKRIRKLFDSIEMLNNFNIRLSDGIEKMLLTDMRSKNSYVYRTERIQEFFDSYYKKEKADDDTVKILDYLIKASHPEICHFLIDLIENDEDDKIRLHHLAVLLYCTCFPASINEFSSGRVALMIKYGLKKTDFNIDFICDVLIQLAVNFSAFELSHHDWQTLMEFHDSDLNPKQVVNIVIIRIPDSKNSSHDNFRLDHIIDLYNGVRRNV